jgi:hypothetical protein
VAALLRDLDHPLYVNVKRFTGLPHRDRDQQFRYLQAMIEAYRAEGQPILSVDAKKKELIGAFANAGATWAPSECWICGRHRAAPHHQGDHLP